MCPTDINAYYVLHCVCYIINAINREPVSEAIRGNFGTFDLFLERLKEMRDDYCGAKSYQSSSSSVSFAAAAFTAAAAAAVFGGKANLKVAILLQIVFYFIN